MVDSARRRLVITVAALIAPAWFLLDQATKLAAVRAYANGASKDLGPVVLRVINNEGGAFSLPIQLPWLFVVVTIVVVALVVRALPHTTSLGLAVAYGMVMGGAVGNAADRIFRSGAVVDMIDLDFPPLRTFPVFNVADIGITVGAAAVAILMLLHDRAVHRAKAEPAVVRPLTGASAPSAAPPPPPPPPPAMTASAVPPAPAPANGAWGPPARPAGGAPPPAPPTPPTPPTPASVTAGGAWAAPAPATRAAAPPADG